MLTEDEGHGPGENVVVPSEYSKVHGLVPVKLSVIVAADPLHIEVEPVIVAVGLGRTTILIGVTVLTHPVVLLRTVKSALYVPGVTAPQEQRSLSVKPEVTHLQHP